MGADFISLADQDDKWLENKVESALNHIKDCTTAAAYVGSATTVNERLEKINRIPKVGVRTSLPSLLLSNQRAGMTFVFNREAAKFLLDHKTTDMVMHDWWFELIFLTHGVQIFEDDNSYVLYRQHSNNVMGITTRYRDRIKAGILRGTKQFLSRSKQAAALNAFANSQHSPETTLVSNLIQPISISFPALMKILIRSDFFRNRIGIQRVEARVLLIISYCIFHMKKGTP